MQRRDKVKQGQDEMRDETQEKEMWVRRGNCDETWIRRKNETREIRQETHEKQQT